MNVELDKIYEKRFFSDINENSEIYPSDEKIIFNIQNRTVDNASYQDIIVQNDNNSRTITFRMQRYFEETDLSLKNVNIRYTNPLGESDETFSGNRVTTSDHILFDWIVSEKATAASGELQFDILFYDDEGYSWHTKPAILLIEKGLSVTSIIPKPSQDWIDSWRSEAGKILTICVESAEKAIQIDSNVSIILDATKSSMEYVQQAEEFSTNAANSADSALDSKNTVLKQVSRLEDDLVVINKHLVNENIHLNLGERESLNSSLLSVQEYAKKIENDYKISDVNLTLNYKAADKVLEAGYLLANEALVNDIKQIKTDYTSADSHLEAILKSADTEILNQAIANADFVATLKATIAKNEAISKSELDASNKANTAEVNAKTSSIPIESKGTAGGVAELDENGKVTTTQLPQIVHDAYEHSQITKGNPHGWAKEDFDLDEIPNVPTNLQTPTFTESSTLTTLLSGETLTQAFGKLASAVRSLITHIADTVIHITAAERSKWNDKYTKSEVDNLFSAFENDIDWKEAVSTFSDIATTYPNPQDGWTVNVKDTDYTYRYNGNMWVAISANAIPKATKTLDGLMTKEKFNEVEANTDVRHSHINKTLLDTYTQADANIKSAVDQRHSHTNKTILDGITAALITSWNTVENKVDKVSGKGLSTNDYATVDKDKLAGIAVGANKYELPLVQVKGTSTSSVMSQKAVTDAISTLGGGDMSKAVYDTNNSGVVDNSEKVNGLTVLTAVPASAKFTDTIYQHPNSGVTAGTYKSVTVNAQGHVASGTNPTTLGGYGITDAEPKFTKNTAFNKNFGTAVNTVCQGNDARLSDSRPANGGNAGSATKLQTARTINGVAFDGTKNITITATSSEKIYTATIGTAWVGTAAPYTQVIAVSGMLAADTPIIDLVLSGTAATDMERLEAWGMVGRIVTAANSITVTCYEEKPAVAIPIQIKVVR